MEKKLTNKEFLDIQKFLEKNPKLQVYICRSPDSDSFILRLCEIPIDWSLESTKNLTYVKIYIPEIKE